MCCVEGEIVIERDGCLVVEACISRSSGNCGDNFMMNNAGRICNVGMCQGSHAGQQRFSTNTEPGIMRKNGNVSNARFQKCRMYMTGHFVWEKCQMCGRARENGPYRMKRT